MYIYICYVSSTMLTSEPTTLGNVLSVESNLLWTHVHSYIHTSHTPLKIVCLIKIHDQTEPAYLWVTLLREKGLYLKTLST